ncbi:MAG TPA: cytidylate kinase-like family protein [Candidatus Pullichristensenella stercorigallinarum]|uniref:Cytidylate kinase-like family protein n=1 Tax=Candidatus Pullichristensenella stercorigallinarum TaxID=2840909 RepID=A0A9D1CWI4_9FIRM|nr:cytidylate kinase-like family protein [Candidatus Pullichristensenella stercorigallinarum]
MQKSVITISREFGSGGRTIGRIVAEKLGFAFYDQDLILKVAKESGLAEQIVEKYDEYATHKNSLLYALALSAGAGAGGTLSFVSRVQQAQAKIITELANKGSCVIVGRGGDYILRGREDCLHAFIHADMQFRAERVVRLYGDNGQKPEQRLRDKDERRKLYYRSFTMREWGDMHNYHIALDSGALGMETCVDILVALAKGGQ